MRKHILEDHRLEIIVFVSGAVGMGIELIASRVVAPYFGNSLVVWTSLIGVILGSLSAGYYFGGKMADRFRSYRLLGNLLLLAAGLTGISAFIKEPLLSLVAFLFGQELRSASLVAILLLFGPVSFILGIVSPYAARLKLEGLENSGRVVGNLYAMSTLGSIVGTFLAGFYLIPTFGNTGLLYGLAFVQMVNSCLPMLKSPKNMINLCLLILLLLFLNQGLGLFKLKSVEDVDSKYGRILVRAMNIGGSKPVLAMGTDNSGTQSAINLNSPDELYFEYTKAYSYSSLINSNIKKALMIGGGGYSFPRYFLSHNRYSSMDVVEIDQKMTELARKYFLLTDDVRMSIFHQDARSFVKNSKDKYDVIYLDAFSSLTPPPHLTTAEFMTDLRNHLTENGFLMINIISSKSGVNSSFWRAEIKTLRSVFPLVETWEIEKRNSETIQNLMMVAYMGNREINLPKVFNIIEPNSQDGKILTDDWFPVEFMTSNYYTR